MEKQSITDKPLGSHWLSILVIGENDDGRLYVCFDPKNIGINYRKGNRANSYSGTNNKIM